MFDTPDFDRDAGRRRQRPTRTSRRSRTGFIVWIDNGRLRAKNRSSGQVFNVTTGGADPVRPGRSAARSSPGPTPATPPRTSTPATSPAAPRSPSQTTSTVEAYPACDAGRIVYMRFALLNEWASIRLFNLASGQTTVVTDEPALERVATRDLRRPGRLAGLAEPARHHPGHPDLREEPRDRARTSSSATGLGNQTAPVISGTTVAWEDDRSGRLADLVAGHRHHHAADPRRQHPGPEASRLPSLVGRQVAFQSDAGRAVEHLPGPARLLRQVSDSRGVSPRFDRRDDMVGSFYKRFDSLTGREKCVSAIGRACWGLTLAAASVLAFASPAGAVPVTNACMNSVTANNTELPTDTAGNAPASVRGRRARFR